MPSREQRDLQILLRHRHQLVRMRTRIQQTLQSLARSHGLRCGQSLWTHARYQRDTLLALYPQLQSRIDDLDRQTEHQGQQLSLARRLVTHPGTPRGMRKS